MNRTSSHGIEDRINRIYAAVAGIREEDLTKFPPKVVDAGGVVRVWQDFRGGMTDADLQNAIHALDHNIAHMEDHLRKWAGRDEAKKAHIRSSLASCRPFLIVKDLSDNDKHGYPPRDGGLSKVAPRLVDVARFLRMTTGATKGSSVGMVLTTEGAKVFSKGGGTSEVVTTGIVLSSAGDKIGDFRDLALEAVECVEALLKDLGLPKPSRKAL